VIVIAVSVRWKNSKDK